MPLTKLGSTGGNTVNSVKLQMSFLALSDYTHPPEQISPFPPSALPAHTSLPALQPPCFQAVTPPWGFLQPLTAHQCAERSVRQAICGGQGPSLKAQCFSGLQQRPDRDRDSSHPWEPSVTKSASDPASIWAPPH